VAGKHPDVLSMDNSGQSELRFNNIIITMTMTRLLKCIIDPLMCGRTMVAMTDYCDNVMVIYMESIVTLKYIVTISLSSMIHLHHNLFLPYLVVVIIVDYS
jgi:hypothetical protein